jgi:prepilin-type N-terminal cleavage/methylation domain-containing protein
MQRISIPAGNTRTSQKNARGFTLAEVMVSLFILVTVTGAVFSQINQMQKKSNNEAIKVDLSQEAREFIDQTVRDLHMAGYPNAAMYSNPQADTTRVAVGLVSVSSTQILLEGDVNNDGNVYSVNIYYVPSDPNDVNCPCIRRSAMIKGPQDSLHQPLNPNYSETEHVVPPGTGLGQSGEDLFSYYDQNGNPVTDLTQIATIKTVKVNLSLRAGQKDLETNKSIRTALSATVRLNL